MAEYSMYSRVRHWPKRLLYTALALLVLLIAGVIVVRHIYDVNLQPVSSSKDEKVITVESDATVPTIANDLKQAGLIRQVWAFERYVRNHSLGTQLQAGTYKFSPSQSARDIARQIADGKVAVDLVTILPGARLSQIRDAFVKAKFDPAAVDAALDPAAYAGNAALTDKPAGASLEGFLYPDSYQKSASTDPKLIVEQSLSEMAAKLTPDLRAAYAKKGLNTFQAVTLASIVEQEVSRNTDRAQAAQVFLKRIEVDMPLGSDVTAFYGSVIAGQKPSLTYDSPYNTLMYKGLPPGPISNVSESSLNAIARPADTDWLYFVAGDDGNTYFSKTFEEHNALIKQYCNKLCNL
ncbi:MAG TPA: endolytic transglycosylase MltG [Candidatus Saccharimonadales bacterium]|jgi:UPF0755 protein